MKNIQNLIRHFIDVYKRQAEYDERYPENNLDTILTDDPLNDSLIEEIKMCIRDRYISDTMKSKDNTKLSNIQ